MQFIFFFILQVKQRADECIRALDILTKINSGSSVTNVLQSQFDWTTLEVSVSTTHQLQVERQG